MVWDPRMGLQLRPVKRGEVMSPLTIQEQAEALALEHGCHEDLVCSEECVRIYALTVGAGAS